MFSRSIRIALVLGWLSFLFAPRASAQVVSAAISGTVTDPSAAAVSAASVTVRDVETGAERGSTTDASGRYQVLALPVGQYEVSVKKNGFEEVLHGGIHLAVGQEAIVNFSLQVGSVQQRVIVNEEAPSVSATTADISGLVGEQQVKNLPLNGRSFDLLMTLNPGVVNFTWEKTGALVGVSNSTTANMFSVSGNRPQQNLFLLNGVEFTGAAENNMTPGGASGQLLGVDAVREFNILRDSYDAEYGKKPGGQVVIVTQSGTNNWHGSVYEFLRNNILDARNYFDAGSSAPPFKRNDFGASAGGPIQKDRTFFFMNYEGFRQALNQTSVAFIPDGPTQAQEAGPTGNAIVKALGLMNLFPSLPVTAVNASTPGIFPYNSSPLQSIREDFGTARLDHNFSGRDSASAVYTIDDSYSNTATVFDPFSTDLIDLREQVFSLQETHVFSPSILNTARVGFSRAGYYFTGEITPGSPAAAAVANGTLKSYLAGVPIGALVVGGSQASNPQAQLGLAGNNNGSNLSIARNIYTYADQASWLHGRHQLTAGVWFQQFQSNENIALSQYGQLTFTGLPTFTSAAGGATLLYNPTPTPLSWRSLFGAFFVEDKIRVSSRLTVSLGFRDEFTTGWNEKYGRAANYALSNGVAQCQAPTGLCLPVVGNSFLSTNRAAVLPQPRLGVAWSPLGTKTVIRAGVGMYNDLQDALGYRGDQNAPFNPVYSAAVTGASFAAGPISRSTPTFAGTLIPGGVQPDMYTPTIETWSLRIEQQLSPNTSLSVGYVGNHGYHELVGVDENALQPVGCTGTACQTTLTTFSSTGVATTTAVTLPTGTLQIAPVGTAAPPKPNTRLGTTWTWMSEADSSYNSLQVDFNRRFTGGLTLRGIYTWSKTLDDGDSYNNTAAGNDVALLSNPYNPRADWGLATFDVRNVGVLTASYALPLGRGKHWLGSESGFKDGVVSGWTVNSIVTLQGGFPFTPQLSYNPSNSGDTRNPVRPFLNANFNAATDGPAMPKTVNEWFNPALFAYQPTNSGFLGDLGRQTLTGPGLATWDFSVMKDTRIRENLNLQFRAEIFNLLDRANFNTPNLILAVAPPAPSFTPVDSPTAGQITSTSTSSRQVQFGLKLLW